MGDGNQNWPASSQPPKPGRTHWIQRRNPAQSWPEWQLLAAPKGDPMQATSWWVQSEERAGARLEEAAEPWAKWFGEDGATEVRAERILLPPKPQDPIVVKA